MKVAAGMIVFNGDFVLSQVLESIYPFVDQIIISEGCVGWFVKQGFTTSTDDTNEILHSFPDPMNKMTIIHGTYPEKHEQCQAFMSYVQPDIDYLWCVDSDEMFTNTDSEKLVKIMDTKAYEDISFKSVTYFGGLDCRLTGFEWNASFKRILRYYPEAVYSTHRPPTLSHKHPILLSLSHEELYRSCGIVMHHVSYVSPKGVSEKIGYYKGAVSQGAAIDDYFVKVWLPWVMGHLDQKKQIEQQYRGVHEFKPEVRGDCYTTSVNFSHLHPILQRDYGKIMASFNEQLKEVCNK